MAIKWSDKGVKDTIVDGDQFMMIDSEDVTPSTTNKRVTFETLSNDSAWKKPVRAATVVAGVLNDDFEDGDTIDDVLLVEDDRILIKDQDVVNEIMLDTVGVGFTSVPEVVFDNTDTGGTGATATVEVSVGNTLENLQLTSGGKGYTSAPTMSFVGGSPSTPATATATVSTDDNGIYVVQSSGAPVRATDVDILAEFLAATTRVIKGKINANTVWSTQINEETWFPISGLGVFNVKHIYSEDDFPPVETINTISRHPLDNNTEYIIANPLTVSSGLFIDAGFKVLMRSFSTETNVLTFTPSVGGALFSTLDFDGSFTGVAIAGTGEIQLTGMDTTNLQVGRHININQTSATTTVDYSQLAAEIVSVDSASILTVKSSVAFIQTESGDWDNKARLLELERSTFDNIGTGSSSFITATFTRFKTSEFFMFHCEAENFDFFGAVVNCNIAIYSLNEFENINDAVKLTSCESVLIGSNNWRGTQGAAGQLIQIDDNVGESIADINNNNLLTTGTDTNAIEIGSLTTTSRVIVTNNTDLNPDAGSLFSNLDETDSRLIVDNNVGQKNSITSANVKLDADPTNPNNTTSLPIVASNVPEDFVTTADFIATTTERISVDADNATITYLGLEDTVLKFDYNGSFQSDSGTPNAFLTLAKNLNYIDADSVTIRGQTSGSNNATAGIDVTDGLITAVTGIGGTNTGYDVSGETVVITGDANSATRATGTAVVDGGGKITSISIDDGQGFLEIDNTRNYVEMAATTLRHIGITLNVPASTGEKVRPQYGNFNTLVDLSTAGTSITVSEV